jgi:hypothetical protein
MTFRSRTLKTMTIALAVASLGASAASATPMTSEERQAIAARGVGAPTPAVVVPRAGLVAVESRPAAQPQTGTTRSSDDTNWGAIAGFAVAAIAACVALLAVNRRRTPATPR